MGEAWYRWFPGDYGRDTRHLSLAEDGAYRRLLDAYYSAGGPLAAGADALYRIAGAHSKSERSAVDTVAAEFFPVGGDGLRHNSRADRELAESRAYSLSQSLRGRIGNAKRWGSQEDRTGDPKCDPKCDPCAIAKPSPPQPQPQPHKERTPPPPPSGGAVMTSEFLEFYAAYPRHEDKRDAWKAWVSLGQKRPELAVLLAAIERQKAGRKWQEGFIKAPASWLRKGSWEDEPDVSVAAAAAPPGQATSGFFQAWDALDAEKAAKEAKRAESA